MVLFVDAEKSFNETKTLKCNKMYGGNCSSCRKK